PSMTKELTTCDAIPLWRCSSQSVSAHLPPGSSHAAAEAMFGKYFRAAGAGADAAKAHMRLAARRAQRVAAATAGFAAAGVLMGAGGVGMLIAIYLVLAPALGHAGAAAIVSAAALALGVIVWFFSRRALIGPGADADRPSELELQLQ